MLRPAIACLTLGRALGLTSILGVVPGGCEAKPEQTSAATAEKAPGGGSSAVVARIDDQVITVAEVEERISRLEPFSRARYASAEQRKRLLENLVRFELLAREARAKGYDQDPDVQRVLKNHLIDVMLKREVDDKLKTETIPDTDVEAYYGKHLDQFRRPEQVRVSQVFTTDQAKADRVAVDAQAARGDKPFRALVEKHSEDEDSKLRAGDLTFFDREATNLPRPVVDAAFALKEIGDTSPAIRSDKGFHVLRLTQRRLGFTRPLEEVAADIRRLILADLRSKKVEDLVAEMRKKVPVQVYEAELRKVTTKSNTKGNTP